MAEGVKYTFRKLIEVDGDTEVVPAPGESITVGATKWTRPDDLEVIMLWPVGSAAPTISFEDEATADYPSFTGEPLTLTGSAIPRHKIRLFSATAVKVYVCCG